MQVSHCSRVSAASKYCLSCVQGAVTVGTTGDGKKVEELETRLKQERSLKEEIEQKYRYVLFLEIYSVLL